MLGEARLIHESEFYRVERFANHVVRVVRLPQPFRDADDVERACRPVQDALDLAGRARVRLLIDTRGIVGRNDPTSEKDFAPHRRQMARGFSRVAILVKTPIGMLHAKRLLLEDGTTNAALFLDEAQAVAYLNEPVSSR